MSSAPRASCEGADLKRARLWFLCITAVVAISVIVLRLARPGASGLHPPCPFHVLTGLHCPGCGTLRALHQLLSWNVVAAFGHNPLMMLSLPFVAYSYLSYGTLAVRGRSLPRAGPVPRLIWGLLVVILAYWVLRNIPYPPFTFLAP